MRYFFICLTLFAMYTSPHAQLFTPLYTQNIANSKPCTVQEYVPLAGRVAGVTVPGLYTFLPAQITNKTPCILIIAGGGYARIAIEHEGFDVANYFASKGFAAFVLKYRNPIDTACFEGVTNISLVDAKAAMHFIHNWQDSVHITKPVVGVIGFSAGGHIAASLCNENNNEHRLQFCILGYPVISMEDSIAHKGSQKNLLGTHPTAHAIKAFSMENKITAQHPPTFIIHAQDDKSVLPQHSLYYKKALANKQIPHVLHIIPKGGHGFGLNNTINDKPWIESAYTWLMQLGIITN